MKKNKKTKRVLDLVKIKQKAIDQFVNENDSVMPSVEFTEITENGKIKIIILRDDEKNILAHFQLLDNDDLLKLNN